MRKRFLDNGTLKSEAKISPSFENSLISIPRAFYCLVRKMVVKTNHESEKKVAFSDLPP